MKIFGDSISTNSTASGASTAQKSMSGLAMPELFAVSGAQAADQANTIQVLTPDDETVRMMIGTNDVRIYKGDATKKGFYKAFLLACLMWLLTPVKQLARTAPGLTYTGTWGNTVANTFGKYSDQVGAKVSGTFSGDVLYLFYIIQNIGSAKKADVKVDGVKVGELDSNGAMNTQNGASYANACKRFAGFGPGSHTFEIIVTSGGARFYFNAAADGVQSGTAKILLSNIARFSAAYNSANGLSDAITDDYNTMISDVISDAVADGFDVVLVDNHADIDPATHLKSDGVHWNDDGHLIGYNNFQAAS